MKDREGSIDKANRILEIYDRLLSGEVLNKADLAAEYEVTARSIQRDIDVIRDYYSDKGVSEGSLTELKYDRALKGYRLVEAETALLSSAEVYAVIKILLENRSLCKPEMNAVIRKILNSCLSPADKKVVRDLVNNEVWNYVEPRHGKKLIERIWDLGNCIHRHRIIELEYRKTNGEVTKALVKPVGLVCSEYYFYLIAYYGDADKKHTGYPTVYRMDRIQSYRETKDSFHIPYKDRFEEGEFRKRIPFMYTGQLQKKSFVYTGPDIDAVLDRLPTAEAEQQADGSYKVTVEAYGDMGIDMWLRSQGNYINVLK